MEIWDFFLEIFIEKSLKFFKVSLWEPCLHLAETVWSCRFLSHLNEDEHINLLWNTLGYIDYKSINIHHDFLSFSGITTTE